MVKNIKMIAISAFAAFAISGCNSSSVVGVATDDYIVGGKVEIYSLDGKLLTYDCKSGDFGIFECSVPNIADDKKIAILVKGGKIDKDGNSSTTDDQSSFEGTLAVLSRANEGVVVSPYTSKLFADSLGMGIKVDSDNNLSYIDDSDLQLSVVDIKTLLKDSDSIMQAEQNLPTPHILKTKNKEELKRMAQLSRYTLDNNISLINNISLSNENFRLQILHINDTHSNLEPIRISVKIDGEETYVYAGGYAKIAKFFKDVKASDFHAIALHAGDAVQGTLYYTLFDGKADIETLNEMDLDAMTIGNHEFDKGAGDFYSYFAKEANFPVVSCDIDASADDKLKDIIKPYIIKHIDGEKVAIVGDSIDSSVISNPGPTIEFSNYLDSAKKAVEELESKDINKIVFLTHIGYDNDKILAQNVPDIDVIVGGHSHTLLGDFSDLGLASDGSYPTVVTHDDSKTVVVSSWKWGEVVGDLNVVFDKDGKVVNYSGTPVMLVDDKFLRKNSEGEKVEVDPKIKSQIENKIASLVNIKIETPDTKVEEIIQKYKPQVDELMNKVVATSNDDLIHVRLPGSTDPETNTTLPYGSMIAPHVALAMYEKAKEVGGCDFALQNAGGVRISIPKGDITIGEIYTLLPFGNTLVTLQMSGEKIKEMLEDAIDRALIQQTNTGAFPYLAGAKMTINTSLEKGSRITEFRIKEGDNWVDMDMDKTYTIATNSYVAGGGDYYSQMKEYASNKIDTGYVDAETFMEYVENKKEISELPAEDLSINGLFVGVEVNMNDMSVAFGDVKFSNGYIMNNSWGFGSGAFHKASDPSDEFYTITDRGVNIDCDDEEDIIGEDICEDGKIFPYSKWTPTIVKWKIIDNDKLQVQKIIPIKDSKGLFVTGVSNALPTFDELPYDINGDKISYNQEGIDSEAIAVMNDGSFYVGEEYSPSILHIDANGTVLDRMVPQGLEDSYSDVNYTITSSLPQIIQKRHKNRGIEALTVSPDEKYLYFATQSPLDNPDDDVYKTSRVIRLYKMEIGNPSNIKEYYYQLEEPDSLDESEQKKVKLSEMSIKAEDDLIVLERGGERTKLFEVKLDDSSLVPSDLEDTLETNTTGATPLSKTLVFDSKDYANAPEKIEGVANLGNGKYLLINDNDFGIEGDKTSAIVVDIK